MKPAINQHNYEAFFLLYADGELSAADKLAVELFVQENPRFAEELEILQQLRLPEEHLVFNDKSNLYRYEAAEINLNNYEEHFLLYVDDELSADAKEKTERFVLQHPSLQEAFMLLKQTRLEPETVLFTDKASLYRKEEKKKPVFYLNWQRVAVAAALIGFAVLFGIKLGNNNTTKQTVANRTQVKTSASPESKSLLPSVDKNSTPAEEQGLTKPDQVVNTLADEQPTITVLPTNSEMPKLLARNNIQENPVQTKRENTFNGSYTTDATPPPVQRQLPENTSLAISGPTAEPVDESTNVQTAAYKELDTESNDEKKSLLVGSLEINKDKLRGFFRKAGSLFRGKAKADDDKTESRPSNTRSLK